MVKKIFIVIFSLFAVGAVVWFLKFKPEPAPSYQTEKAAKGTLKQTVEATGKVESMERINLNFKSTGRITDIYVKVGDKVTKNQILARLESKALLSRVSDAQAQVNQEKARYDEIMAGSSDTSIKVAEDTVSQREKDLEVAQNNVENLGDKRDVELRSLKEKILTEIRNQIVVSDFSSQTINNIFTNTDVNLSYSYNPTSLSPYKRDAESAKKSAEEEEANVLSALSVLNSSSSDSEILSCATDALEMLDHMRNALSKTMEFVDKLYITTDFTKTEQDAFKTEVQTRQSSVTTSISTVVSAKTSWTDRIAYYNDQESSAKNSVEQAKAALSVAKSQLENTKSGPRKFQIDSQLARIAQSEAALSLAFANLEDAIIRAPLAGVITKKYFQPGEQSSMSKPVLEMIGDATLEIEVDISESDISKVKTGQKAEITLDAFGEDLVFTGDVTFVDPAETLISDVVYYKVKIAFTGASEDVKPGMTANVSIITNSKDSALYVPARAIHSRDGEKYVKVLQGLSLVEKTVTVGMRGDDGIEILSGVSEGEDVVTFVEEK